MFSFTQAATSYTLSDQQIRFFDDNGYLVLKNWIPAPLLQRLQTTGNAWIADGLNASPDDPHSSDYLFAQYPTGRTMYRVDYLHNKGQAASLELLGSPIMLDIAESLCGANFVPTYESMVFKQEGRGRAIEWHQDAVHPRDYRIFNVGVYLDESQIGNGALRVVPKSQMQKQDVCAIGDEHGWTPPGVIQVELEAGDILIHDVMVVHGSEEVEGNTLRRTIYFEFRAAEQILNEGPWDHEWVDKRLRLVPLALKQYQRAFPHEPQFEWKIAEKYRPVMSDDDETELKIAHVVHMAGSYCSAGSVKLK
jgi:Phytanoyl-CoA dioxygenase (PhyH)